jgi:hypothetical protein
MLIRGSIQAVTPGSRFAMILGQISTQENPRTPCRVLGGTQMVVEARSGTGSNLPNVTWSRSLSIVVPPARRLACLLVVITMGAYLVVQTTKVV